MRKKRRNTTINKKRKTHLTPYQNLPSTLMIGNVNFAIQKTN